MTIHKCITVMLSFCCLSATAGDDLASRVERVAQTQGLVAFWDFRHTEGKTWTSYHDPEVVSRGYPVFLRRIGDPKAYTPSEWPYADESSKLSFDTTGPFGHAINVNQGYMLLKFTVPQTCGPAAILYATLNGMEKEAGLIPEGSKPDPLER